MRRDIIIVAVILFFTGLGLTIIASYVMQGYDKSITDIIGTIGFFIWFISLPTGIIGGIMEEK